MNNFDFINNCCKEEVNRVEFILSKCRGKKVLDLGCVQHSFKWAINSPEWLYKKIQSVAHYVLGVDYLQSDIEELKKLGFNVISGDVTRHLPIEDKFEVIVAGNLIEHLANFEGFFLNLKRLLIPDGIVLISTANPLYFDHYFFSALKNSILINPEHTCWIDPIALNQLALRFGFKIREFHFIKGGWKLKDMIFENKNQTYDMFHGRWISRTSPNFFEKILRKILYNLFRLLCKFNSKLNSFNSKYDEDELEDRLYKYFVSQLFQLFWGIYKIFIIRRKINKYELYIALLEFNSKK